MGNGMQKTETQTAIYRGWILERLIYSARYMHI